MTSADAVREAALYLEYFLKGLSECNVVGSYAVQFLEVRNFNMRLEASLADHLIVLLINMKGLLMKLDSSLVPFSSVGIQTEEDLGICSLCNSRNSFCTPKENLTTGSKTTFREEESSEKSFESPEIAQLLSSPLIELKQELPCVDSTTAGTAAELKGKNIDDNSIYIAEGSDAQTPVDLVDDSTIPDIKREKCNVALSFQTSLDNGINIQYASTSHLDEAQGEILLDNMDQSDAGQAEGLMYSIYAMGSCGSLQLVSRVLSNSNTLKDNNLNEPVEKAMIEINNLKEEYNAHDTLEGFTLQADSVQDTDDPLMNEDPEEVALDDPISQDKSHPEASSKILKATKSKLKTIEVMSSCVPVHSDIVKLGPEALQNTKWCEVCEKEFPSLASLEAHISRTHRKAKWCNTCNKNISSEDMSSHVSDYHSDVPHVCHICGQSLRTNGAFQRHMDIHKGVRGSACEVCGQTFSRTEYYRDHKRIHTGEKPFKCKTCKKTFTRSSNLYTHMRIHNSEQQHICNVCLKSFARADKLKEHAIRHLQVKRYSCRLCPKSYRERRDLIKHLSKVHAGEHDSGAD